MSEILPGNYAMNEDTFLQELITGKANWTKIAAEMKDKGFNNEKELSYADAYRVLLNRFTIDKQQPISNE